MSRVERLVHTMGDAQNALQRISVLEENLAVVMAWNDYLANAAGISDDYEAIRTHAAQILSEAKLKSTEADIENPAQPVPNPASETASETTEEALSPETYDHPENLGIAPNSVSDVPADSVDTAMSPGTSIPTAPTNELQDVTAPVAGTETQRPLDETRIESEVRVGNPDNPQVAFPWTIAAQNGDDQTARALASVRLAELRIEAGLDQGDKYQVAGHIQTSASTNSEIIRDIDTLQSVRAVASKRKTFDGVPKISAEARQAPSLSSLSDFAVNSGSSDLDAMDLFIN